MNTKTTYTRPTIGTTLISADTRRNAHAIAKLLTVPSGDIQPPTQRYIRSVIKPGMWLRESNSGYWRVLAPMPDQSDTTICLERTDRDGNPGVERKCVCRHHIISPFWFEVRKPSTGFSWLFARRFLGTDENGPMLSLSPVECITMGVIAGGVVLGIVKLIWG